MKGASGLKLLSEVFLTSHKYWLFLYFWLAVLQNFAFIVCIVAVLQGVDGGALDSASDIALLEAGGILFAGVAGYFISSVSSFYLQTWLANQFSIRLHQDLDQVYDYAFIQSNEGPTLSTVMKDVTYEFARFGTNIISPVLESARHIVSALILLIFLAYSFPQTWVYVPLVILPYGLFWLLSRKYFSTTALKISHALDDRQRLAEYKYRDANAFISMGRESYVQLFFESIIKKIASYNVNSKTLAMTPRVVLESTILVAVLSLNMDEGSETSFVYALGLAAIRILPSIQGLSAGISSIQLSWPALEEYALRRYSIFEWRQRSAPLIANELPSVLTAGMIESDLKKISYQIPTAIELPAEGVVLFSGQSGCGKSTLLRILCGLEPARFSDDKLRQGRKGVCLIDQHEQLLSGTVEESFSDVVRDNDWSEISRLRKVLFPGDRFLTDQDFLRSRIGTNSGLSGGELQRIKIMKSLLSEASVFIWDEPFDGIHKDLVAKLLQYMRSCSEKLFLIIDHNTLMPCDVAVNVHLEKTQDGTVEVKVRS